MKRSLFFAQKKPLTVIVFGTLMLALTLWFLLTGSGPVSQIVVMGLAGLTFLGYTVSYEISTDFKNKRHLKMFGLSLFTTELDCIFPDYIVVFSGKFKQGAEWGSVAAIGKERRG